MKWYNDMTEQQKRNFKKVIAVCVVGAKRNFKKVIAVCVVGAILILLIPMIWKFVL